MTNVTNLSFDDGEALVVTLTDAHVFNADVTKLDIQEHGLMIEETEENPNHRLFFPWHMVASIDQAL